MMKTLNDYMEMSYRLELVEDKEEDDILEVLRYIKGILPASTPVSH